MRLYKLFSGRILSLRGRDFLLIGMLMAFASFLFVNKSFSQSDSRIIKRVYKMEDGLSSNRVYSIVQDSLGFIWMATSHGLNRFDGLKFKHYYFKDGDKNSISSNQLNGLLIAKDKRMWISLGDGVDIYNPYDESFTHFDKKTHDGIGIRKGVRAIIQDREGDFWIGSQRDGLFYYSPKKDTLILYKNIREDNFSISQDRITTLCEGKDGLIWVGTYSEGLCSFSKKTKRFLRYKNNNSPSSLSDNSIQKIYEDSYGNLWIGTFQKGIDRFDRNTGDFIHFPNKDVDNLLYHIQDIYEYSSGKLFISSDNGGGIFNIVEGNIVYDRAYNQRYIPELSKFIYSIFKDREGGLWLGAYFDGVEYIAPQKDNFSNFSCEGENGAGKVVNCIVENDEGLFFIGTDDDGIYTYNQKTGNVQPYWTGKDINSSYYCIHDLLIDDNKLYAATYGRGLEVFDLKNKTYKSYLDEPEESGTIPSSRVFSLFKASNGRIYVGTTNGLSYYNKENDNFTRLKPHSLVNSIVEDFQNNIWFTTNEDGLYRYDVKNDSYEHYTFDPNDSGSIIRNTLSTLAIDDKGQIWVGSDGYGICLYDKKTNCFKRFPDLNFPNNVISSIIPGDNILWIGTQKGLVKWNLSDNQTTFFSKSSGLYNEQFIPNASFHGNNGRIILGTADGFSTFFANKLSQNNYQPYVVLTNFLINGEVVTPMSENSPLKRSVEITNEIVLTHKQRVFGVDFASLSFINPDENEYAYKLDGLDNTWHTMVGQNRHINYTSLPSGEYILKIKGTNGDKIWSPYEVNLKIRVRPPLWLSTFALVAYLLILVFLISMLIRYFIRKSKMKHEQEIKRVAHEAEIKLYDSKIRFFTNIAHEIKTPLSLIIGPLEEIMQSNKAIELYGDFLSIIQLNSKRLLTLVSQLLDFRKVESGSYKLILDNCDLENLIHNVAGLFNVSAQRRSINLIVDVENISKYLLLDKEALTKVLSNLISNALKYAEKEVSIKCFMNSHQVVLRVEDDGQGIPLSERKKVFSAFYQINSGEVASGHGFGIGLNMTKSLVELMGGSIDIMEKTQRAKGSIFEIRIPTKEIDGNSSGEENLNNKSSFFIGVNPDMFIFHEHDDDESETLGDKIEKPQLLVVDDNQDVLDFIEKILKESYTVTLATGALEALKIMEEKDFDLILSDIMMEGMDGLEFCKKVKSNIATSHIPFVLLTAKDGVDVKIQSLDYGSDAFIEKPFSPKHLKAQIRNLLKKREELRKEVAESPLFDTDKITPNKLDRNFLNESLKIIEENLNTPGFSVDTFSRKIGMSRTAMYTKIKALTGMTPNNFIKMIRLKIACKLLVQEDYNISEIGYIVGFSSPSYFSKCFIKQFGISPSDFTTKVKEDPGLMRSIMDDKAIK